MNCVFCAPLKWLCGKINAGCAEFNALVRERLQAWDYGEENDLTIWEREVEKDRVREACKLSDTDAEAGFALMHALAEQGSVWSMYWIALAYGHGTGCAMDLERAEEWARRAFEGGCQRAQLYYARFNGLRKEFTKCEEILSVGAANDWAPALYWLARYRLRRAETRETLDQVRPLLERAIAKGGLDAQRYLALLMLRGRYGLREIPNGLRLLSDVFEKVDAPVGDVETTTNPQPAPTTVSSMAIPSDQLTQRRAASATGPMTGAVGTA